MSIRFVLAFAIGAIVSLSGCATTSNPQPPRVGTEAPAGQDARLVAYNVAFGALVGGLGAVLNGSDGPPLRRLARGAGRGAAGGTVAYAGKWMAGEISRTETLAWGWPARLTHDLGASMIENASHDRPVLDRFGTHLGFVRLDVRPATGAVGARLLPVNALAFGLMLVETDSQFDLGRTLALGTPVFTGDDRGTLPLFGGTGNGFAFLGNVYLNRSDDDFHDTAAHELVHVMQHHEFVRTASLYGSLDAPLRTSDAYREAARWIYLDNPGLQALLYFGVEGGDIDAPCKYDNWLEREAEAFGSRRAVGVCP